MSLGGGSSAGGGSTQGAVDYPGYMKTQHEEWLDLADDLIRTAIAGASPYSGFATIDPDSLLGSTCNSACSQFTDFRNINLDTIYSGFVTAMAYPDTLIAADVSQAASELLDDMTTRTLPKFEEGMNDGGAVLSSSFVVGRAIILDGIGKGTARLQTQLRLERAKLTVQVAMHRLSVYLEWQRLLSVMAAELARLRISGRLEADKLEVEMRAKDRLFDLQTLEYGNNVMASIAGAAVGGGYSSTGSSTTNTIGGALSGAAAGAMAGASVGGPWGAAIGGGVGLLGGLLS